MSATWIALEACSAMNTNIARAIRRPSNIARNSRVRNGFEKRAENQGGRCKRQRSYKRGIQLRGMHNWPIQAREGRAKNHASKRPGVDSDAHNRSCAWGFFHEIILSCRQIRKRSAEQRPNHPILGL